MSKRYLGGIISKTPPTVTGPTDGEGGSAPGIWTLDQQAGYAMQGLWPKPLIPKELFSWGKNNAGQLGLGNTTNRSSPNQVGSLTTWSKMSGGEAHTLAIKSDGTLWAWGGNFAGQLGLGNTTYYSSPKQVGSLTTWSKVAGGYGHAIATKTDGTLWTWGQGNNGALGLGNTTYYSSPKQVGALTTWLNVVAGYTYTLAIKTDGTLWSWGRNNFGQLGIGDTINKSSPNQVGSLTTWLTISGSGAMGDSTLAAKTDGTLWSWGHNAQGQLGLGDTTNKSSPNQVGSLTTWLSVAGGYAGHSIATKTDGTLWSWGSGTSGALGLGNTTNYSSPKQVGSLTTWSKVTAQIQYSGAIKTDGTLWSWGRNNYGQLGLNSATYSFSSPNQVGSLTTWLRIASGYANILATKSS